MSDVFFKDLDIKKPDYFLNVQSSKHGEMTAKIMIEFEKIVGKESPDLVIVYGDTNTTLAGALVASKLKISIAHIEAGIRMNPKDMPEEINRVLTDRISSLLFCPSGLAVENLKSEGIKESVYFVGDIMYDLYLNMEPEFKYDTFENLGLKDEGFVLVTLHRDYNVDNKEKLESILRQLLKLGDENKVVFPIHPRTKKNIRNFGMEKLLNEIEVTEPLDYSNLMGLVKKCKYVITDSGGLQKEAYFARKRAFVVMPDTGWQELVDSGLNVLCDPDNLYDKTQEIKTYTYVKEIYGNGRAGEEIVDYISNYFKNSNE
jgi:UDP-N-acetylglucosamine 2-epimerase (non-hydrolysing)